MKSAQTPWCPSARPGSPEAVAFAIAGASPDGALAGYLERTIPAGEAASAVAAVSSDRIEAAEVVRFAAPCAASQCRHFERGACTLATRIVGNLARAVDALPACAIRKSCRWWRQEGKSACLRCPALRTDVADPSDLLRRVAAPPPRSGEQAGAN